MARHTTTAPEHWREVLAHACPALRANLGVLPDVKGTAMAIGPASVEVIVIDDANRATHAYEFDHFPSAREIACCELAVYAPHN